MVPWREDAPAPLFLRPAAIRFTKAGIARPDRGAAGVPWSGYARVNSFLNEFRDDNVLAVVLGVTIALLAALYAN